MYEDLERHVSPILKTHAKRINIAAGIPFEDAMQELRIAMFQRCFDSYDFNAGKGKFHLFVSTVLRYESMRIINNSMTNSKVPHVVQEVDGRKRVLKQRWNLISIDEMMEQSGDTVGGDVPDPHSAYEQSEDRARRLELKMKLRNKLCDRDRTVLDIMCHPPEEFLIFLENKGESDTTNGLIAEFIGVSKNAVDYSTLRIRRAFTQLAESEFPEISQIYIDKGTWPMIHMSKRNVFDYDFVRRIIKKRKLDPRPTNPARDIQSSGEWAREVHFYHWGVVLFLKKGKIHKTLVLEGNFNLITGGVSGAEFTWKYVSDYVTWYSQLVKKLSDARKQKKVS